VRITVRICCDKSHIIYKNRTTCTKVTSYVISVFIFTEFLIYKT